VDGGSFLLVLLDEEPGVDLRELAKALAKALRCVRYDALNALKQNPYVPFKDLSAEAAENGRTCLDGFGVRAAVLPEEALPAPVRTFAVHNADALGDALHVQTDLAGKMRAIAWTDIEAASVAAVTETSIAHGLDGGRIQAGIRAARAASASMTRGLPSAARAAGPDFKPQSRTDTYELLCVMPAGKDMEIRFRSDQFNYDYLAERLSTNSDANFRALVEDVLPRATNAIVNSWAQDLVETGALPPSIDKHRLERLNQWLKLKAQHNL
jgi:hypothetical protein